MQCPTPHLSAPQAPYRPLKSQSRGGPRVSTTKIWFLPSIPSIPNTQWVPTVNLLLSPYLWVMPMPQVEVSRLSWHQMPAMVRHTAPSDQVTKSGVYMTQPPCSISHQTGDWTQKTYAYCPQANNIQEENSETVTVWKRYGGQKKEWRCGEHSCPRA